MTRSFALVLLVGCGRVAFDPLVDAGPNAHDEDGDGIADVDDVCPWVIDAAQEDSDGDGVGDRCDPNRDEAIDRIALFRALTPDEPAPVTNGTATPSWKPGTDGDSWQSVGTAFAAMDFDLVFRRGSIAAGFDVIEHRMDRRQVGIFISPPLGGPYYYGEVFSDTSVNPFSGVSHFDGTGYVMVQSLTIDLAEFAGRITMRLDIDVDQQRMNHEAVLGGNVYANNANVPGFVENPFRITVQESVVALRYVGVVVTE